MFSVAIAIAIVETALTLWKLKIIYESMNKNNAQKSRKNEQLDNVPKIYFDCTNIIFVNYSSFTRAHNSTNLQ